ncbi:hypothetical protein LLE78_12685, partial [Staphylococcus haemolyticus]|uniref:hypothetical protein n=1 Tax=Staphylococcus haemolyticus TaxID=1283 RepID=UPI001D137F20
IGKVFKPVPADHVGKSGSYVDGIWVTSTSGPVAFTVNIQPLSDKEIDFLRQGGQRIVDPRKIYVNNGDLDSIALDGEWVFLGQRWKVIRTDNRPWRKYCKVIVDRYDQQ